MICANQAPDHTTIARFRQRHEAALAELFGEVLALCAEAGLVRRRGDRRRRHQGARQRVAARDARLRADRARDPRGGRRGRRRGGRAVRRARGDELPPELATRAGPARLAARGQAPPRRAARRGGPADPARRGPSGCRRPSAGWKRSTEVECRANAAYEAYRARGRMKDGRRFGRPPKPYQPPATPAGQDQPHRPRLAQRQDAARLGAGLQRPGGLHRGSDRRSPPRSTSTRPTSGTSSRWSPPPSASSPRPASTETPEVVLADAGYWHQRPDGAPRRPRHPTVLIPPDASKRKGARPGWDGGLYAFMRRVLATDHGGELYAKRQAMIEPVFAAHQVQPPHRPLPTPRQIRLQLGMAADHRHPQPAQAPPQPDRARDGLREARRAPRRRSPVLSISTPAASASSTTTPRPL